MHLSRILVLLAGLGRTLLTNPEIQYADPVSSLEYDFVPSCYRAYD